MIRLNMVKKVEKKRGYSLEIVCVSHLHPDSGTIPTDHSGHIGEEINSSKNGKLSIGHSESRRQYQLSYVTLGKKTGDSDA